MTTSVTNWVHTAPAPVTFRCIQKAIVQANRAPPPARKHAWAIVYELSKQYKRQEDAAAPPQIYKNN